MNISVQKVVNESKYFNPHTYFKPREDDEYGAFRDVWDAFEESILSRQNESMPYRGLEGVVSYTLPRRMSGREIINEFLGGIDEVRAHAITLDQIATEINRHPDGEDHRLIFFVIVDGNLFTVCMGWNTEDREWYIEGWDRGACGYWDEGGRVFRNTTLKLF